jgi:AraC-like DNA-binding protein
MIKNPYFHIHYCNSRQSGDKKKFSLTITRTIQHHELVLITGGKGSLVIDKKSYPLQEGVLVYIHPGILHSFRADPGDPFDFLSVHFSLAEVSFNDSRWAINGGVKELPLHVEQELTDYFAAEELFRKLVKSWAAKLPGYEFAARTVLQQLLIAVDQSRQKQKLNYAVSLKIEQVIQYMHQNINSKLTLNQLSAVAQLSPAYLSRTFKETTGYSVIGFLNKIKTDKAKELMLEGNHKVKEVARALGFTDEFYFSRIFKKIEGISPSEFYSKNVHVI